MGHLRMLLLSSRDLRLCLPPQIATTRRLTVHFNPPSSCVLEISVRGVKIAVKADDSKEHSKVVPCSPHLFYCCCSELAGAPMHVHIEIKGLHPMCSLFR